MPKLLTENELRYIEYEQIKFSTITAIAIKELNDWLDRVIERRDSEFSYYC